MGKRKRTGADNRKKVIGVLLFLAALFALLAVVSHDRSDDAHITGKVAGQLNPFEVEYRNHGGMFGAYLAYLFTGLLGWLAYFIPLGLMLVSLRLFSARLAARLELNSILLFVTALLGTMMYDIHFIAARTLDLKADLPGGLVADRLTALSVRILGALGSYLVLSGIILVLLILFASRLPVPSLRLRLPSVAFFKKPLGALGRGLRRFFTLDWLASMFGRQNGGETQETATQPAVSASPEEIKEGAESPPAPDEVGEREPGGGELPGTSGRRRAVLVKSAEPLQLKTVEYTYPKLELLTAGGQSDTTANADELSYTARLLKETLETFGVRIEGNIEKFPGPVITRYEFKPASGIKINQIVNLSDDLALALKAKRIRIIAPIPGKAAVGVEIPNRTAQIVHLRDILESEEFRNQNLRLPLALGKTTSGKPYVADLTRLPHLLIAGATGSGKSVCINIIVTSLLYRLHPHEVRFIMIDPKMLELSVYGGIPHLGRPVVTKPKRAEKVLSEIVVEMENRYRRMANAAVRNIEGYNKKQENPAEQLPYIVILVDELADLLMSAASAKTEMLITRLAQMARAVGIHLILATQRPSVDVITGLIKANFPARIAFQVSSKVDSRTIIDGNGAEKLLGSGDMLFLYPGHPEPTRIHGAYVSSEETGAIVEFINGQGLEMFALDGISQAAADNSEREFDFGDPLFKEACEVVVRHRQGSVSLLQRRLGVGYQRAARLIDKLEEAGIVSPFDGSKAREVMVDKAYLDNLFQAAGAASSTESESNV